MLYCDPSSLFRLWLLDLSARLLPGQLSKEVGKDCSDLTHGENKFISACRTLEI